MTSATTYLSPNGHKIIGTAEQLLAITPIDGINPDGTPVYLAWVAQKSAGTLKKPGPKHGKILFVDEKEGERRACAPRPVACDAPGLAVIARPAAATGTARRNVRRRICSPSVDLPNQSIRPACE